MYQFIDNKHIFADIIKLWFIYEKTSIHEGGQDTELWYMLKVI